MVLQVWSVAVAVWADSTLNTEGGSAGGKGRGEPPRWEEARDEEISRGGGKKRKHGMEKGRN